MVVVRRADLGQLANKASHLSGFRQRERVFVFDAEIPDSGFDLRMPEQHLHGAQIAGLLINWRSLCPAEGVCSVILFPKAVTADPFLDEPRILSSAEVIQSVNTARKDIIVQRASAML